MRCYINQIRSTYTHNHRKQALDSQKSQAQKHNNSLIYRLAQDTKLCAHTQSLACSLMVFRGWKIKACLAGLLKAFCVVEHTLNTLKPLRNTHIGATHRPRYWVDLWLLWRITDTCLSSGPRFHSGCLTLRSPRKELRNAAKPRPGIRVSWTSRDSSASNPTTAKARRRLGLWTLMT